MDNLKKMDRFFEKFNLSKLNQEETEIMKPNYKHKNRNSDQKSLKKTKIQGQMASQGNSIKHLEKS